MTEKSKFSKLFFPFLISDILADKEKYVKEIAAFLGISDYDLDEVVINSSIDKARARREAEFKKVGKKFHENILYNKGKANSWETLLNPETAKLYDCEVTFV